LRSASLARSIYDELLADIVELRLSPGEFLLERKLSERLGVSRTPVREAIKRLIQDGWLIAEDGKRPVVRGFSLSDGRSFFEYRSMIEQFALNWAFENGESRRLAGQLDICARKMRKLESDKVGFIRADVNFHSEIINNVRNDYLSRAWDTVGNQIIRMAMFGMDYLRTTDKILSEHENLIVRMWENRQEEALDTLRGHHAQILEGIARQLDKLTSGGD
jgi:DNA-binding GntR family transcriptional regulator